MKALNEFSETKQALLLKMQGKLKINDLAYLFQNGKFKQVKVVFERMKNNQKEYKVVRCGRVEWRAASEVYPFTPCCAPSEVEGQIIPYKRHNLNRFNKDREVSFSHVHVPYGYTGIEKGIKELVIHTVYGNEKVTVSFRNHDTCRLGPERPIEKVCEKRKDGWYYKNQKIWGV